MKQKWSEREYLEFKKWEKGFDRPLWWMFAVVIGLPIIGAVLGAMTK
jgi:ABC-type Fe3+ transport system permease subunit